MTEPTPDPGTERRAAVSRAIIVLLREVAATYLDGLDLRCENYLDRNQPAFDQCARNGRPRGGADYVTNWCLQCEVRDRLGLADAEGPTPKVPVDKSTD